MVANTQLLTTTVGGAYTSAKSIFVTNGIVYTAGVDISIYLLKKLFRHSMASTKQGCPPKNLISRL